MAAVPKALEPDREAAGRMILQMLDDVGLEVYAAAWVFSRDTQRWRYVVSTPLLRLKGPGWIYERLLKVFVAKGLPAGVTPLDVFIIDPEMEMGVLGASLMGIENNAPGLDMPLMAITDADFGPFAVPYGFIAIYRRIMQEKRRAPDVMRFADRARKLSAQHA
ncbi:hypothetical protein [Sediminicoccus sp. KRV36]|uniref:hypothetical protein n=1 Tax=Sediminicoccus sp. KRV36 TaxID=3133721 RepID=UPI00200D4EBD|nr:hypothetical protein [Sediminicoccus rosea]UPY35517.1 hypothetical protein LHU95_14960 [Sediminicoccus rosea]